MKPMFAQRVGALSIALAVSAFTGAGTRNVTPIPVQDGFTPSQGTVPGLTLSKYVKHVVIIVQERRSFENLFAGYKGADAPLYGHEKDGKAVKLRAIGWHAPTIASSIPWEYTAYDGGRMDQFNLVPFAHKPTQPSGDASYAYLQRSLIQPYWQMAHDNTLADQMFPPTWGDTSSFTGHLDFIAGTAFIKNDEEAIVPTNTPWGCDAPKGTLTEVLTPRGLSGQPPSHPAPWGPFPCFTSISTMAGTLDSTNVSWKYYVPSIQENKAGLLWSAFRSIKKVFAGPDWSQHIVSPETTILKDVAAGTLPSMAWVVPTIQNSDTLGGTGGPAWVTSIVNAIGKSPYWNNTAIFVVWDGYGGWYDDAPPPQIDGWGLGFRVPCIVISAYARVHHVSHTQYEYGSILKFVEQAFHLPSLGHTDERATSISDAFDFSRPPHRFNPIATP